MPDQIIEKDEVERFSLSYISQVFDDAKAFSADGFYFRRAASASSKNNTKTIMDTFLPESVYFDRCLGNSMWTDTFFRAKGKNDIDSKAVSVHNSNNRTVFCKSKFKTARGGNRGSGVKTLLKDIADQLSDPERSTKLLSAFAAKQADVIDTCLKNTDHAQIRNILVTVISFAQEEFKDDPAVTDFLTDLRSKVDSDQNRKIDTDLSSKIDSDQNRKIDGDLNSKIDNNTLVDTLTWIILLASLTNECFKPCIEIYKKSPEIHKLAERSAKDPDHIPDAANSTADGSIQRNGNPVRGGGTVREDTSIRSSGAVRENTSARGSGTVRENASVRGDRTVHENASVHVENAVRDSVRLTEDYSYLVTKYVDTAASRKVVHENADGTEIVFPVTLDHYIFGKSIVIRDDSEKEYQRPSYLDFGTDAYRNIMSTYTSVSNNPNIRVDDWSMDPDDPDTFLITTSRTHYYDSLLTNRSLDYHLDRHTTLRELLFCDNNVGTLKKSKLSNHLGYNGFIISADGYVPFVRRGNDLSTENGKWGDSIQASLKVRYALTDTDEKGREFSCPDFDANGLLRGIRAEIRDEMTVDLDTHRDICADKSTDLDAHRDICADKSADLDAHRDLHDQINIIAAYRNLIEGGKPQLLFYAQASASKPEIHKSFMSGSYNESQRKVMDGESLFWIHIRDLIDPGKLRLLVDGFEYSESGGFDSSSIEKSPTFGSAEKNSTSGGFDSSRAGKSSTRSGAPDDTRFFSMSPSAAAPVAMLIQHIRSHKELFKQYL